MASGDLRMPLNSAAGTSSHSIPVPPPLPSTVPTAGHKLVRRVQTLEFGSSAQKAAILVDIMMEDETVIPEQIVDHEGFERAMSNHLIYIQFYWLWNPTIYALVLLNFFERPLWCLRYGEHPCADRAYYYHGVLPYLSETASLICEGALFGVLALYIFCPLLYEGWKLWWNNPLNRLKLVFFFLLGCDIVVYACVRLPFRVAPYVRVALFILSIREMRDCVITVCGIIQTYLSILALWSLFLLLSSWLGYVIFEDTLQGKIRFTSFGETLYQMFVLYTTANNPDAWLYAYKESRWSFLFFLLYLTTGLYFVTSLTLAVIYDSFKMQLGKRLQDRDLAKQKILDKAFNLVANDGFLDKEHCRMLFEELSKYRKVPTCLRENFDYLFGDIDRTHDLKFDKDEFQALCNAIVDKYQERSFPSFLERYNFYHSNEFKRVKKFVQSNHFDHIVLFILLLNLIAVVIETTFDIWDRPAQSFWQKVEFFFGCIYMMEMTLKIFSSGLRNYWRKGRNKFDFVITWTVFIAEVVAFIIPSVLPSFSSGEWTRYLIVGRILRLTRILLFIENFRAYVATFFFVVPNVMPYAGIIFCVQCIYCSVGLQLFGGLVNSGNPALPQTELYRNDYLIFNFNDFSSGIVVLFNMQVVNNWFIWMSSYWHLAGTAWALVYFVSYYLIDVLLLLNLIVAFVLDTFFAEKEIKGAGKKYLKINNRSLRVRFNMDKVLHQMLSEQLEESKSSSSLSLSGSKHVQA